MERNPGGAGSASRGDRRSARRRERLLDPGLELARRIEPARDVTAADELAPDVHLGNRRPVAVLLDRVPELGIRQDVDRVDATLRAGLPQGLDGGRREAT